MKGKLQVKKEMEIESGLKEYCGKYGFDAYIEILVSTHALIRGGWSYNNAKGDLATKIEDLIKGTKKDKAKKSVVQLFDTIGDERWEKASNK